ncbi:MAG TPA: 3D domain-containing protein [Fimbriimonadaceae bacterium]|nr:3D domain-containing protein [Fimbriimonadaceae bacterium]
MRRFANWGLVVGAFLTIASSAAVQTKPGQETKVRTEYERIPYEVKYVFDREMGQGRITKVQNGVDGEVRREILISMQDGEIVQEALLREDATDPVPAIFHMGKPSSRAISRGTYTRAKVMEMECTAYTPRAGRKHPTYTTRTGTRAEYGVIAVDPEVIPLGTLMYVEGYGFGIAEDTGSAIKGNIIDVCIESRKAALDWGRKTVKVHIFRNQVEVPETSSDSSG